MMRFNHLPKLQKSEMLTGAVRLLDYNLQTNDELDVQPTEHLPLQYSLSIDL